MNIPIWKVREDISISHKFQMDDVYVKLFMRAWECQINEDYYYVVATTVYIEEGKLLLKDYLWGETLFVPTNLFGNPAKKIAKSGIFYQKFSNELEKKSKISIDSEIPPAIIYMNDYMDYNTNQYVIWEGETGGTGINQLVFLGTDGWLDTEAINKIAFNAIQSAVWDYANAFSGGKALQGRFEILPEQQE